ncbi:myosin-IIIb-like [Condylostylus longicornis]|uniref:myosin-IIIb-like n=1 Tax=Condylostylus longicornis TaxID=2530218 RepID=UPI00244DA986|nr:myosin-IIIb-like [Condylostylus longicornis]
MARYINLSHHINFTNLPSPKDRFELLDLIGEGTYGEVYSARDRETNKKVAVKILESIADNIEEIEEEYLVLRDLSKHPNLPEFYGIWLNKGNVIEDDQLWFVMELCDGGSVTDLVHGLRLKNKYLSTDQIAYIVYEMLKALIYLHENHCMHRDIKGHNILFDDDANIKLVDFGVSSHLAATLARRNTSVGTPYWMAPEVIACEQQLDQSYDSRCDVWSVGITVIELAEGEPPLSELHPMRALFQIPRNPPPALSKPDLFSPQLNDFIATCLVKDLENRPFARELLDHPFLQNINKRCTQARIELKEIIEMQKVDGRVTRHAEVTTKHGKLKSDRKSKPKKIYLDDLAALEALTENAIVEQLEKRFEDNQIYTYIGDILVAVNPFAELGFYTTQNQKRYVGKSRSDNPPHIFAVADAAHQALIHQKTNQAIVISGESGSGKTESANLLLKQLVYLGKAPNRNLELQILQVNPIMEAFGNARTGINSNSSRFGKYLDLTMTRSGKVTGARISVYLLEQSRVVQQADGEGNFHIFYYLYDGLESENRLAHYHLDPAFRKHHKYLADTRTPSYLNVERWKQLMSSFKVLGFRNEEVDTVNRVLSAILNLGDLEFGEAVSNDNTDPKARIIDVAPVHRVSKLLGIEVSELVEALTSNSVVTKGETITKNNTMFEAGAARDAMAKGLYGRLFDWMVNQINLILSFNKLSCNEQLSVGLLDIFGFENFPKNSFEQLCINIANEQIQYYFNQHIFTWEQQEYIAEGIPVDLVEFSDNRPVLDMLLSRPLGLLALLDEESRFPRATDRTFIEKCHNNIKSKFYIRPKSDACCFAIQHFAGRVIYQADSFLEKNRNFLPAEVIQLVRQSKIDMVRFLFQCPITKTGNLYNALQMQEAHCNLRHPNLQKIIESADRCNSRGLASQSRAQQTVSTYFRYSLMDLLQKMVAGSPQFVRCIKPNDRRQANTFEPQKVLKQLRYAGVMETIRIRQLGFSHRFTFAEFLKRYCFLAFGFNENIVANRENCRLLLVRLRMDGWALGKTKVFLKYYHVEFLARQYEENVRKVILLQSCIRMWLCRLKYKRSLAAMNKTAITLQRYIRGYLTRRNVQEMKENRKRELKELELLAKEKKAKENQNIKKQKKQSSNNNRVDKENLNKDVAATIIQNYYRSYSIRKKKLPPEQEAKVKIVLNTARNRIEALRMLQKEGFKTDDAERIIQKYFTTQKKSNQIGRVDIMPAAKRVLTPKDQQVELASFAQKVHSRNQDIHKNLRRNRDSVPMNKIEKLPDNYKRPPGFVLIPGLLGINNLLSGSNLSDKSNSGSYYDLLQKEEIARNNSLENEPLNSLESSDIKWDLPFSQKEIYQREIDRKQQSVVMSSREDILGSRLINSAYLRQSPSPNNGPDKNYGPSGQTKIPSFSYLNPPENNNPVQLTNFRRQINRKSPPEINSNGLRSISNIRPTSRQRQRSPPQLNQRFGKIRSQSSHSYLSNADLITPTKLNDTSNNNNNNNANNNNKSNKTETNGKYLFGFLHSKQKENNVKNNKVKRSQNIPPNGNLKKSSKKNDIKSDIIIPVKRGQQLNNNDYQNINDNGKSNINKNDNNNKIENDKNIQPNEIEIAARKVVYRKFGDTNNLPKSKTKQNSSNGGIQVPSIMNFSKETERKRLLNSNSNIKNQVNLNTRATNLSSFANLNSNNNNNNNNYNQRLNYEKQQISKYLNIEVQPQQLLQKNKQQQQQQNNNLQRYPLRNNRFNTPIHTNNNNIPPYNNLATTNKTSTSIIAGTNSSHSSTESSIEREIFLQRRNYRNELHRNNNNNGNNIDNNNNSGVIGDGQSYLGPFNFRQYLRPTQGPTESLRKRKGINPPTPPPPQRGKTIL